MNFLIIIKKDDVKARNLGLKISDYLEKKGHKVLRNDGAKNADYALVLGGDGTLIHTACELTSYELPLVGINTGNLGFLTAVEMQDWQKGINSLLSGRIFISERITLEISTSASTFTAVNEAVIKGLLRVIELEVTIGGEQFLRVAGDGVIVATQTGSTAYSLSSGGPIVDAELNSVVVTPINPIGLPVPSAVLSADKELGVNILSGDDITLIIDGQENVKIKKGENVSIKRGAKGVKLVYFSKSHLINSLNLKFGLSSRKI